MLRMPRKDHAVAGVEDTHVKLHVAAVRNIHRHCGAARCPERVRTFRGKKHPAAAITVEAYGGRLGHNDFGLPEESAVNVLLARGRQHVQPRPVVHYHPQEVFSSVIQQIGYLELERVVTAAVFPRMAAVHHQGGHRTGPVETDEHTLAAPLRTGLQITEIVAYPAVIIQAPHRRIRIVPRMGQGDTDRIATVHGIEFPAPANIVHLAPCQRRHRRQKRQQNEEKPFHKPRSDECAAGPEACERRDSARRHSAGEAAPVPHGVKGSDFFTTFVT